MQTAVLIDGAFFLRRFHAVFTGRDHLDPTEVADTAFALAVAHIRRVERPRHALYRIFFYDCPPLSKKMHYPISGRAVDLSRSSEATFRSKLHDELRQKRKVALRLGRLGDAVEWQLRRSSLRALLRGELEWSALRDDHFQLDVKQKAVDMKIGLDIASLVYKRLVDQVILVAGDSDFVPAAKLARREGIDFILNPMGQGINPDLYEHIDGLHSVRLRREAERVEVEPQGEAE